MVPAVVSITACLFFISAGASGVMNGAAFGGAACWNHSVRSSTSAFMGERVTIMPAAGVPREPDGR